MSENLFYPLRWPAGWPRTKYPKGSAFSQKDSRGYTVHSTIAKAMDRLEKQITLLGCSNPVLSSNLIRNINGAPRSGQPEPADRGIAVYFMFQGKQTVLACDKWDKTADNIIAISKHIEAMRGMDRWGVGNLKQAFAGYEALPAPKQSAPEQWWLELGVSKSATRAQIVTAYRELAKKAHPDNGGSAEAMSRLNVARDTALEKFS